MRLKLLLVLLCIGQFSFSQTKNEKEERIKVSEFPQAAQKVVESLPEQCKRIKFYRETDGQKESFEAKFKYKGKRYSLEFSKEGVIEDLEVTTKFKVLEQDIQYTIKSYFESDFSKYKLIKNQEQFVYQSDIEPSEFVNQILTQTTGIAPNFEIIVEVKANKKREMREYTFDSNGEFVNFRTINPTSYEHVLY